jgi:hypothetical protein
MNYDPPSFTFTKHSHSSIANYKYYVTCYPSRIIIFRMNKTLNYLESSSLRFSQVHIIHFQLCLIQNSKLNYSYEFKFMS